MLSKRKGKIYFSQDMVMEHTDTVAGILAKLNFVPFRVESLLMSGDVEMAGCSSFFHELPVWEVVPIYRITLKKLPNNEISISSVDQLTEADGYYHTSQTLSIIEI